MYIGNLSFYTTEEQIYELFSKCGDVKRIVMGLDKFKKTPCGFCFVEYPLNKQVKLICMITPLLCWKLKFPNVEENCGMLWKDCFQKLENMTAVALKCTQTCGAEFSLSNFMKKPEVICTKICMTMYCNMSMV
jgi:hypothetical protein